MTISVFRVILAVAALAACLPVVMSAESRHAPRNVEIIVDGAARPHFLHDGRFYVEAIHGREYAIRLRNPFPVRVAVALSVDGLNTIDARETTAEAARKWVLGPHQVVTISGWQTSPTEARRFEFTTEERSYGHAIGRTANLGIISAVFFRERGARVSREAQEVAGSRTPPAAPPAPASARAEHAQESAAGAQKSRANEEYAATGMGRRTGHAVTRVWLDLEDRPAVTVDIRYEFRPQLVRLGVLPAHSGGDALSRRERARGFQDGFAPVPPHLR